MNTLPASLPAGRWVRLRGRLGVAALLVTSIALALAVSELVLRWREVLYTLDRPHLDPTLGYTLIPGLHGVVDGVELRFNSRGLRDAEYTDWPAPGVSRILFVGDSITFGQNIPVEATYVKRVEATLRRSRPVEALNGGVPGYNACNEEAFYRLIGASYHPDIVVWQFCLNDVDDAWRPAGERAKGFVPLPASWRRALEERLVLWGFVRAQWYAVLHHLGAVQDNASESAYARHVFGLYRGDEVERRDRAWECVRRASEEIVASHARMLMMVVPFEMQAAGDPELDAVPQTEIERRCRENRLSCVDLLPAFRGRDAHDLFAMPDFIHLSERGHELAASTIAPDLFALMSSRPSRPEHRPAGNN